MNDKMIRVPARSLKEQFSRGSEAWKEQSDPIFRFSTEGDWWGFPFFSLSASPYFGDKGTLCLYWPLGTLVMVGPKVLEFYLGFLPTGQRVSRRMEKTSRKTVGASPAIFRNTRLKWVNDWKPTV